MRTIKKYSDDNLLTQPLFIEALEPADFENSVDCSNIYTDEDTDTAGNFPNFK